MSLFVRTARRARQFPLPEGTPPEDLLRHLNLLKNGRLTNAAVLLFGKAPQRFLISSEIKCAHFHGTEVAKPIPSYQVYKGTVFALVDQAVDFVLSKIALSVGTRAETVQAPVAYELPKEVVTEAIRQRGRAPRLHGQQQRAGHALFRPVGSDELRPTAAPTHGGEAARRAPVAAWQSAAGGVDVPAPVYRTDGNRYGGHDPTLCRGWLAGAGVRCQRGVCHNHSEIGVQNGPPRYPSP